jgi:hypothetical protein
MVGERMPLKCPSCDIQLIELGFEIDIFRCPVENITWKLSEREDGRYLKKVYAQPGYRGPTTVKVD